MDDEIYDKYHEDIKAQLKRFKTYLIYSISETNFFINLCQEINA